MRTIAGMLLVVVARLAGPAAARADDAPPARPEWPAEVRGEGRNPEAATNAALTRAKDAVWQYLVVNYPDISWQPTTEYLRRRLAVCVQRPERADPKDKNSDFSVVYRVNKLTQHHLAELREFSRAPWMYRRHRQTAVVLGGLVLVLLVCASGLRFDEATHGYYTGRVLGAAAALTALVGYGVWWWI
jgi:hypothetical protein